MFWFYPYVIIGSCLELLGVYQSMNVHAGLPDGYGSVTLVDQPYQLASDEEKCWLASYHGESWYDAHTCQSVVVENVLVQLPCGSAFVVPEEAPCEYLEHFDEFWCPAWAEEYSICSRPVRNCE